MKLITGKMEESTLAFNGSATTLEFPFSAASGNMFYKYHALEVYVESVVGGAAADNWEFYADIMADDGATIIDNLKLQYIASAQTLGVSPLPDYLTGVAPSDKSSNIILELNQYQWKVLMRNLRIRLTQGAGSTGNYDSGNVTVRYLCSF